jgi:hypothetical protein
MKKINSIIEQLTVVTMLPLAIGLAGCYQSTVPSYDGSQENASDLQDLPHDFYRDDLRPEDSRPDDGPWVDWVVDGEGIVDHDGDGHGVGVDCNDDNASIYPGAPELCNGLDDDCDGLVDEDAADAVTSYMDGDGDGWGACARPHTGCLIPTGYAPECGDCNDSNVSIHPHALEVVGDGIDQDCDGIDGGHLIYVVERYLGILWALDRATGEPIWSLDGLGEMIGIARTDDGTLYLSRYGDSTIAEVAPDGSSWRDVLGGLNGPHGLWWDPSTRTLLIGGYSDGSVHELDPATGRHDVLVRNLGRPISAFRFPGDDLIYISNRDLSWLYSYDMHDGALSAFVDTPTITDIIVPDGRTGLFIGCGGGISMLLHVDLPARETSSISRTEFNRPYGICLDPLGHGIFVSEHDGGSIHLYNFSTGEVSLFSTTVRTPWQCTSTILYDADGDGAFNPLIGGLDCDDTDAAIHPGAVDRPGDGLDMDCDGIDG